MKRHRITYKIVMDVPINVGATAAWNQYVKVKGGENVTVRSLNTVSTEELPEELLPWQERKAERLAVRNLIAGLFKKHKLSLIVTVQTFRTGWEKKADHSAMLLEVQPSVRQWNFPINKGWGSFKVMDGKIFIVKNRHTVGKQVGTLSDPDMKEFMNFWLHKMNKKGI